jgi:putative membrane protein
MTTETSGAPAATSAHRPLFDRPPGLPSDLGELRTVMAADRTLMAWIRTAMAMLSFSFTIYRFLEGVKAEHELANQNVPQNVGLFLAGVGTLAITTGTFEYWTTLRDLNRSEKFRLGRPVLFIALILACAGIALFVSILFRLF